jgi:putative transposase
MPRKLLLKSDEYPYHITCRVNNREPFPLPMKTMWELMTTECLISYHLYDFRIQAFVLMPNHFHMIATTANPEFDLGKVMQGFMSAVTKNCNRLSNRSGRVFSDKYYRSIILSSRYYGHVLKYVYRNPIKGGLCEKAEDYEFSTINGIIGKQRLPLPIHFTECGYETFIPDPSHLPIWLEWINQPFAKEVEPLIQGLLKKKEIKLLIDRGNRRPNPLLQSLI